MKFEYLIMIQNHLCNRNISALLKLNIQKNFKETSVKFELKKLRKFLGSKV